MKPPGRESERYILASAVLKILFPMLNKCRDSRPKVKFLGSPSVMCEARGCGETAAYLFRCGNGPIVGFCEVHARQEAAAWNITLPDSPVKLLLAAG